MQMAIARYGTTIDYTHDKRELFTRSIFATGRRCRSTPVAKLQRASHPSKRTRAQLFACRSRRGRTPRKRLKLLVFPRRPLTRTSPWLHLSCVFPACPNACRKSISTSCHATRAQRVENRLAPAEASSSDGSRRLYKTQPL